MFIDEGFTGFFLSRVEGVYLSNLRDEGVLEFDGMVEGTVWGKDIIGLFGEDISNGRAKVRDRDVLGFFHLSELSRDSDLIDLFIHPSCLKAIPTERPVIFGRRGRYGY